jgi:hypothetical protein
MTRRINPANYEKFFASITLGANATIAMIQTDGTMLVRYPRIDQMVGQKFPNAPLLQLVFGAAHRRSGCWFRSMARIGSAPQHPCNISRAS